MPLKTPAEDSVSPAGSVPDDTDQPYGVVPPVAANVWLYAVPTVPVGSGDDRGDRQRRRIHRHGERLRRRAAATHLDREVGNARRVGVPLKTPAEESVSPAGSAPENTDQLYGVVPPVAANVWLYAVPTVPAGSGDDVVIDSAAGSTVTENAFVAVPPPLTWTVKLEAPAAVGVPLKTPAEDSVSPAGSAPDNTDQPYGVVPPVAASVWLYGAPHRAAWAAETDVVIDSAAGSTVTENAFVAVPPPLAWTVKFETPAADGVPLKTPAEESVSPAGSAPDNTDQPYGVVPPVAANVWLYATTHRAGGQRRRRGDRQRRRIHRHGERLRRRAAASRLDREVRNARRRRRAA